MKTGSEVRERHERQTARRRQSSLAGKRSRTLNSTSVGSLSELAASRARLPRVMGGEYGLGDAIAEAHLQICLTSIRLNE
jgi:RAB protein geranylgeranyltransferase component A